MHQTQRLLLKRLLSQNNQRYRTLTSGYSYEDNIVFHLHQLHKVNLIAKNNNLYSLTPSGIKAITNLDLSLLKDTGFKTFFIGFLCHSGNQYLLKSHPQGNQNFFNLPSGKPRFGEKIESALVRTFKENTGLKLQPENFIFKTLHLKTVKTKSGETLSDD